jgi:hypothetical protein
MKLERSNPDTVGEVLLDNANTSSLIPQDDGEAKFASTGHPPLAFSEKFLVFSLGNCSLLMYNIGINAIDIWNKITHEDMSADLSRWYNIPCCTMALILCFVNFRNLHLSLTILILLILDGCVFPVLFLVDLSPNTVSWRLRFRASPHHS